MDHRAFTSLPKLAERGLDRKSTTRASPGHSIHISKTVKSWKKTRQAPEDSLRREVKHTNIATAELSVARMTEKKYSVREAEF